QFSIENYTGKIIQSSLEIISYDVTFVQKKGNIIESEQKCAELNKTILEYIKQAKSGDVLLIENVKVRSPDGSLRRIKGLSYQIK
ncbi:MAG: GldM family protein, partial [bacterium]